MYLERFVADGYLDADRVDLLRMEANRHAARIVLIVGGRRVLAQNLGMCWDALAIGPGTEIVVEVTPGRRGVPGDQQRAIAGFADRFREMLIPPAPRRARGWFRRA